MEWKAEFRARVERDTVSAPNDTASTHGQSSLTHFRSRLILRMSQGSLSGAVQFQDVRILGAPENASGKTGQDQNTIAFSQAYIQYRIKNNGRMRIGRFDLPLGNERLFSRNQWSLHGRFFEGFLAEYEFGQLAVTKVFRVYLEENYANFSSDGDDTIIDGFYVTSKNPFTRMNSISGLELYGFRELNIGNTADAIQRNTYGGRLTGNLNLLVVGFALEFEGAIQSGFAPGFNSIEGNMSVLNFIFDIPMLFNSQITIGLENYSGDNSATEDIGEGFANPYGAGHKWHGYMDYHKMFPTNGEMGLNETSLRFQVPIFDTYRLAIHTHDFQSGNGSVEFGSEIDIVFTINAGPRLSFSQGYSRYTHKNGSWKTGTDEFAYFSISAVL
jgi:hypothetical protein